MVDIQADELYIWVNIYKTYNDTEILIKTLSK